MMLDHDWPGNVRELANAMEYAWIVSGGQPIGPEHLPHDVRHPQIAGSVAARPTMPASYAPHSTGMPATVPFPSSSASSGIPGSMKSLADVEMEYILQVYAKNNMNKQATATELGISLKTLYNKLHKYEEERRMRAG